MPHSIIHGNACLAYFNKIWGIPTSRLGSADFIAALAIRTVDSDKLGGHRESNCPETT